MAKREFWSHPKPKNLFLSHEMGDLFSVIFRCGVFSFWDKFGFVRNSYFGTESSFAESECIPYHYSCGQTAYFHWNAKKGKQSLQMGPLCKPFFCCRQTKYRSSSILLNLFKVSYLKYIHVTECNIRRHHQKPQYSSKLNILASRSSIGSKAP